MLIKQCGCYAILECATGSLSPSWFCRENIVQLAAKNKINKNSDHDHGSPSQHNQPEKALLFSVGS